MVNNVVSQDIFESVNYEEISFCDTEEFHGGLIETEIYYCPIRYITQLRTPSTIGWFESAGKISQKIICRENYGFRKMKALVETPEFNSALEGSLGRKSSSSDLELILLGTRARLIGFSRKLRHIPMVFVVKDRNGRQFVIGSLVSPAYLSNFQLKSGKKNEDETGASLKVTCNTIIYEYTNTIPVIIPDIPEDEGDFTGEFDTDFD